MNIYINICISEQLPILYKVISVTTITRARDCVGLDAKIVTYGPEHLHDLIITSI